MLATAPGLVRAQAVLLPADSIGCATAFSGHVKTADKPVAGASVGVRGTNVMVVTNELGFFVLPPTVRGQPTISVSAMGYAPLALTLTACGPVTLDIKVLPDTKFKKHGRNKGFLMPPKRSK
ncbi:carboxypeptidase-like regulatory domain-containing protein [Hymenobacter sp. YC55]|nr:carboxypeptidase-like regulatory domain-containing protein [Hymenobacter sp. YC55]